MSTVLTIRTGKAAKALTSLLARQMPVLPVPQETLNELAEIQSSLIVLRGYLKELEDLMASLNKIDEEWATLISQAIEPDRAKFEKIYEKTHTELTNQGILDKAVESRRGLLELTRQFNAREVVLAASQPRNDTSFFNRTADHSLNTTVQPVSLPVLASPKKFSGKIRHWREFIECFNATVGNSNIEPIHKFNHLIGLLEGEALNLVRYLTPSADNYQIAIDLLTERYDDKETLTGDLIQRFHALKPCRTFSDVRQFQLELELLCRQLESLGAELDNPIICSSLENKLSYAMLREIKKIKRTCRPWNTSTFRTKLKELVKDEETNERAYGLQHETVSPNRGRDQRERRERSPTLTLSLPQRKSVSFQRTTSEFRDRNRSPDNSQHSRGSSSGSPTPLRPAIRQTATEKQPSAPCYLCFEKHWTKDCVKYRTFTERYNRVRELKLCTHCLSKTHASQHCRVPRTCQFCQGPHPRVLCKKLLDNQQRAPTPSSSPERSPSPKATVNVVKTETRVETKAMPSFPRQETLYMCTENIVFNPDKPEIRKKAIVIWDSCCGLSYITDRLAAQLQLPVRSKEKMEVYRAFSSEPLLHEYEVSPVSILANDDSGFIHSTSLRRKEQITTSIPVVNLDTNHPFLDRFSLSLPMDRQEPDILLGAKDYDLLRVTPQERLPSGFTIYQTLLGPLLYGEGRISAKVPGSKLANVTINDPEHTMYVGSKQDNVLNKMVEEHFSLQNAGLQDVENFQKDEQLLEEFSRSLEQLPDGRYKARLLWNDKKELLPVNYGLAKGRLKSNLKNLRNNLEIMKTYDQTIKEQEQRGIIERVYDMHNYAGTHYLAHQPVLKHINEQVKVRVVYDGSARVRGSTAPSLNECLYKGPLLLKNLTGVLLRLRLATTLVTLDIEKAFLQIEIAEQDRDSTRFLWSSDPANPKLDDNPIVYRFTRVLFGLSCSPFLLSATVKHHVEKYKDSKVAQAILENIYVDNIVIDVPIGMTPRAVVDEACDIFKDAQMNLREISSNDRRLIESLPAEKILTNRTVKLLGIPWDTVFDWLLIKLPQFPEGKIATKREVLSILATPFDPLGLICPVLLPVKIFMNDIWSKKLKWDDRLSDEQNGVWQKLMGTWKNQSFTLDRRLFSPLFVEGTCSYTLHAFTDASGKAFGVCVYLVRKQNDLLESKLIMAKSSIKPAKLPKDYDTIPKLELQAAKLGIKLLTFLLEQLQKVTVESTFLWVDALDIIHWLKSDRKLDRYVENRLGLLRKYQVRRVPGKENPADIASRGMEPEALNHARIWWQGPSWLKLACEEWPETEYYDPADVPEAKEQTLGHLSLNTQTQRPTFLLDLQRFGYNKLALVKRIVALVLRLCRKNNIGQTDLNYEGFRHMVLNPGVTVRETKNALKFLIREAQYVFPPSEEVQARLKLTNHRKDGIWRCEGRIENSQASKDAQSPIWLPREAQITRLIVQEAHVQSKHAAVATVTTIIRQHYWIDKCRKLIERIIYHNLDSKCYRCARFRAQPYQTPQHPPLPTNRVKFERPFENVGLDYFGPNEYRTADGLAKYWGAIYTCMATRAIALDVVTDCTAFAFLNSFRRFVAQWDCPLNIYSDNALQFKLASQLVSTSWTVEEVNRERRIEKRWEGVFRHNSVQNYMVNNGVTWHFIIERAPWKGPYERLIGPVKYCLKRSLAKSTKLNLDEIRTLLAEISKVVNERPVSFRSERDLIEPLRPIDILLPWKGHATIPSLNPETMDSDQEYYPQPNSKINLEKMLLASRKQLEHFRKSWIRHYLLSLRERSISFKNSKHCQPPQVGDVVLVFDPDHDRKEWRLALILELFQDQGGTARSAKINMGGFVTNRAISHLYPIEVNERKETETLAGATFIFPFLENLEDYVELMDEVLKKMDHHPSPGIQRLGSNAKQRFWMVLGRCL
uniref:Uncharacterized protein n=1 Tax=Meloidogyne enterolobii TaxID=390850 RepID=A0A6V7W044_MELEN|nr:unnamed protein product [Meloidogyne enterolobii]